ncbi:MAG TPA: hypothetical protein VHY08_18615 [Bacillota bacterium]|nr:hypothetical protein [Bacillota bacterium]
MKNRIYRCCLIATLILLFSTGVGYTVTRAIPVGYLAGVPKNGWIQKLADKNFSGLNTSHPTIAVNLFSDERETTDNTGAIYSRSGKRLESLVTDQNPAEILENNLIEQLQKAGYTVIRTAGWSLNADKIPTYLDTDLILGARMKVFWVESKAGFVTSTIRSKVVYDLVIGAVHQKRIIYQGIAEGNDIRKSLAHISDYFWTDVQTSLSQALTSAMNDFNRDSAD